MKRYLVTFFMLILSAISLSNIIPDQFVVKKKLRDQSIYYSQFQPYKAIAKVLGSLAESIDDSVFVIPQQIDSVYFVVKNPKLCPICKASATSWTRCSPQENRDGKHVWWIISEHLISTIKPQGCD